MALGEGSQAAIQALLEPLLQLPPLLPTPLVVVKDEANLREELKEMQADVEAERSEKKILAGRLKGVEEDNARLKEQLDELTLKMADSKSNSKK